MEPCSFPIVGSFLWVNIAQNLLRFHGSQFFCIVELNDSMKEKHNSTYQLKVLLSKIKN